MTTQKLSIIGMGKMGEAIAQGLMSSAKAGQYQICGTTRTAESAKEVRDTLKISCTTNNEEAIKKADIIILSVKPHQVEKILTENRDHIEPHQLIVSICAAITTEQLSEWSGGKASIIRAMPNTPCLIKSGVTAICAGPRAGKRHLDTAEGIFGELGIVTTLEESLFDGVTGLSGCGPAYI